MTTARRLVLFIGAIAAARVALRQSAQNEADGYTRYELLAPGTAKFRIIYEVTATTPGATHYFNPIRKGSVATDEHVFDRATGTPLRFDVVGGAVARAARAATRSSSRGRSASNATR